MDLLRLLNILNLFIMITLIPSAYSLHNLTNALKRLLSFQNSIHFMLPNLKVINSEEVENNTSKTQEFKDKLFYCLYILLTNVLEILTNPTNYYNYCSMCGKI